MIRGQIKKKMMGQKNFGEGQNGKKKLVVKELLFTHILGAKSKKKWEKICLGEKSKKKMIRGQIVNNKWWRKKVLVRGKIQKKIGGPKILFTHIY